MRRFDFTDEQRRAIAQDRFHHVDPRVQRRREVLWLKFQGETHERIAKLAGVSRRTVPRLLDLFAAGWPGLESLWTKPRFFAKHSNPGHTTQGNELWPSRRELWLGELESSRLRVESSRLGLEPRRNGVEFRRYELEWRRFQSESQPNKPVPRRFQSVVWFGGLPKCRTNLEMSPVVPDRNVTLVSFLGDRWSSCDGV